MFSLRSLAVSAALLTALAPLAKAEHTIGNGGGQGEQNFTYALVSFDRFALLCRALSSCALNQNERVILQDLSDHLREVTDFPDYLRYAISEDEAALLNVDGNELPYATDRRWRAPVIVNRRQLYAQQTGSETALPVSVAIAMNLAAEVLLYQRTTLDAAARAALASRLSHVAATSSEEIAIGHGAVWIEGDKLIRFYSWRFPLPDLSAPFSEVTIQDADQTHDMTDQVHAAARCANGRVPDVTRMIVRGLALTNETGRVSVQVEGEALYPCIDPTGSIGPATVVGHLKINASFGPMTGHPNAYILAPSSLTAEID